jgi:glycerophosphoryl diester phosphodiesterase
MEGIMGIYSDMSDKAGSNINTINNSLSNIKNVSFDGVWSGDAYNAQSQGLEKIISTADTAQKDLERFKQVLAKLEQYKSLKERIDALTEEINSISIPSDPQLAAAAMNRKNRLIIERDKLTEEKDKLRQEIETMLSTFKAIESQIELIKYDPNEHKEYMEYIKEVEKLSEKMTPEERAKFLSAIGMSNLLPKNNSDIAHRGSHPGGIWENSLEAFIEAGEKGFWGAEADVRFDENGNLVCSHNAVKAGENPPSFSEYLDICKKYGMTAIIDLKYANGVGKVDENLSPAILKIIEEKGMMDSCVIQTNNFADIPYIRSQSEDARIWLLGHNAVTDDNIRLAKENNVECINFNNSENNSYRIKKVTDAGIDACVWNVQTEAGKQSCLNAGATYVMSDNVLGITPYQEGEVDFNAVKGNYGNTNYTQYYENNSNSNQYIENTSTQFYDNYNSSTNGTKAAPAGSYNGPILLANQGRLNYIRTDGVTVQESWCDISLKNAPELAAFYQFDGEKVVEGTKIKDMEYWVRDDGVQMIGDYVAVATDVIARKSYGVKDNMAGWQGGTYNYGDVVETTLGKGIVMGICTEAQRLRRVNGDSFTNLEIYTLWNNSPYSSTVRAKDYVPTNYANDPLLSYQD